MEDLDRRNRDREYFDKKFAELDSHARERMEAHDNADNAKHDAILSMLKIHDLVLFGNPEDDATPGIVKKLDRLESGVSLVKWIGGLGLSAGVTGWIEKFLHK